MTNFKENLNRHSFHLQNIIEESTKCKGKHFIDMINELSKGVINDIENLKKVFKKSKNDVKINFIDIKKTNKDIFSDYQKISNPFKVKPKEVVVCLDEVQMCKQKKRDNKSEPIQNEDEKCCSQSIINRVETAKIYKKRKLSEFSSRSSLITSSSKGILESPRLCESRLNINEAIFKSSENSLIYNDVYKKKTLTQELNKRKDYIYQILKEEKEEIFLNYEKISQQLNESIQREKYSLINLESLKKEHKSLEHKYNLKCGEFSEFEMKFDNITNNFTFIVEKIKSQQESLLIEINKLKDLIGYILTCYNEKNFYYLDCIVNFMSNNETFIDKEKIIEYKNKIMNDMNNFSGTDNNNYKESSCMTENKYSENNHRFFKTVGDTVNEKIYSVKDINFEINDEGTAFTLSKNTRNNRNTTTTSYSNLYKMHRSLSTLNKKNNLTENSIKESYGNLIKNRSSSVNNIYTTNFNNEYYQTNSKRQSLSSNLKKFLGNNNMVSSIIHNDIKKTVISKELNVTKSKKLFKIK